MLVAEWCFLLRLEKRDVLCFEWVDPILELANVAVRIAVAGGE
jgi:hypothetical protein